jgi:hypothetical protein
MRKNKKTICKPNLILCEGVDATHFIIWYLEYLQKTETNFNCFKVLDFGGNEELPNFLVNLPNYPGYEIVESITIIRDAENSHTDSSNSIIGALRNAGFPTPKEANSIIKSVAIDSNNISKEIKIAFALFPDISKTAINGTLEDLYINNLAERNIEGVLTNITDFMKILEDEGRVFRWTHKTKLHTYFSISNDFVTCKIGEASKIGAFNYGCDEMERLKDLLLEMIM